MGHERKTKTVTSNEKVTKQIHFDLQSGVLSFLKSSSIVFHFPVFQKPTS